jgi:hypothetical protein
MKPARQILWTPDRIAWAIFAAGIVGMFVAFWASQVFGDYGATIIEMTERKRLIGTMFFGAAAFALSGPLTVSFGLFPRMRVRTTLGKKHKAIGLEDF